MIHRNESTQINKNVSATCEWMQPNVQQIIRNSTQNFKTQTPITSSMKKKSLLIKKSRPQKCAECSKLATLDIPNLHPYDGDDEYKK